MVAVDPDNVRTREAISLAPGFSSVVKISESDPKTVSNGFSMAPAKKPFRVSCSTPFSVHRTKVSVLTDSLRALTALFTAIAHAVPSAVIAAAILLSAYCLLLTV
jgi:hypothetical protein